MKLSFSTKPVSEVEGYVHAVFTADSKGTKRFIRTGLVESIEIGIGKHPLSVRTWSIVARSLVRTARQHAVQKVALSLPGIPGLSREQIARLTLENMEMANYDFDVFKSKPSKSEVKEVLLCEVTDKQTKIAAEQGLTIGQGVNVCRTLANTPGGDMTPKLLAKAAKQAVSGLPVTVEVLGTTQMKKLGMGAILGVSKGSSEEPAFIVMEYKGAAGRPIVLAGKGITFDSGGLNLKPGDGHEMHMDMSGGAAVIHTIALAARLKLKKHVVALIPASENMPGNNAVRPHDILKTMSGKTVEVLNTDAEGRLVLADALTYAKKYKPSVVLDVATLTGASMVALGFHASGIMGKDDALVQALLDAGEQTGDLGWRLPLWDEHEDMIKSSFADMVNTQAGTKGRYGGATEGAVFLWQFAKELNCPWAHIDMAPRMTTIPQDELSKGAAGAPVRMLVSFIQAWK